MIKFQLTFKSILLLVGIIFLFGQCKEDDKVEPANPTEASLIFPFENSECIGGTDTTETESTVLFEWNAGQNVDEYELVLTNLNTGDSTNHSTSELKVSITIKKATPYAWYIISKSNSTINTALSETWRFYNAGDAITSYAPFPAEIISPAMAETINTAANVISLEWIGTDVDGDIVAYDVYFSKTNPPEIFESDVVESPLNNVPIESNTVYYWKIITKDSRGNNSDSGTYQFKIL